MLTLISINREVLTGYFNTQSAHKIGAFCMDIHLSEC